jgi:hypothetical protein
MLFHVGQRVVCIVEGELWNPQPPSQRPERGMVYTIRELTNYAPPGLRFEEIVNPTLNYCEALGEMCFDATCFRPVKDTSIDVFTKLLNPTPTKELV